MCAVERKGFIKMAEATIVDTRGRGRPQKIPEQWLPMIKRWKSLSWSDSEIALELNRTYNLKGDDRIDLQCVGRFLRKHEAKQPDITPRVRANIGAIMEQTAEVTAKALQEEMRTSVALRKFAINRIENDSHLIYEIDEKGEVIRDGNNQPKPVDDATFARNVEREKLRLEWFKRARETDTTEKLMKGLEFLKKNGALGNIPSDDDGVPDYEP